MVDGTIELKAGDTIGMLMYQRRRARNRSSEETETAGSSFQGSKKICGELLKTNFVVLYYIYQYDLHDMCTVATVSPSW